MARTLARPAEAGASPVPSLDLLAGVHADAQRTCLALASLMELLQGCPADHSLTAGGLRSLLEPIWSGLDSVCMDLGTATGSISFN